MATVADRTKGRYPVQVAYIDYAKSGKLPVGKSEAVLDTEYISAERARLRSIYPRAILDTPGVPLKSNIKGSSVILMAIPSRDAEISWLWRYVKLVDAPVALKYYADPPLGRAPKIRYYSSEIGDWRDVWLSGTATHTPTPLPPPVARSQYSRQAPKPSPTPAATSMLGGGKPPVDAEEILQTFIKHQLEETKLRREEARLEREARLEEARMMREEARLDREARLEDARLEREARLEEARILREEARLDREARAEEAARMRDELMRMNREDDTRSMSRGRHRQRSPESVRSALEYANLTNPGEVFALAVETLVKESFTDVYENALAKIEAVGENYEQLNWTWSNRLNRPYYILSTTPASTLYNDEVVVTPYVLYLWGGEGSQFTNRYFRPSMSNYEDRRPEVAAMKLNIRNRMLNYPDSVSSLGTARPSDMTQRALADHMYKNIPDKNTIKIETAPYKYSANDLTAEEYANLYPDDKSIHAKARVRSAFRGMLTTWDVKVESPISTMDQYKEIVTYTLRERMVAEAHRDDVPIYFILAARYTSYDPVTYQVTMDKPLTYWSGHVTSTSEIDFSMLGSTMEDLLTKGGYEFDKTSMSATLDMTRFVMKRIDVSSYGGGTKIKLANKDGTIKSVDDVMKLFSTGKAKKGDINVDFAYLRIVNHKTNACFVAALAEFMKIHKIRDGGPANPYTKLYNVPVLRPHHGLEISTANALHIANTFGLHAVIYDSRGKILGESKSTVAAPVVLASLGTPKPLNDEERTIRLLYHDKHYILITALKDVINIKPTLGEGEDEKEERVRGIMNNTTYVPLMSYYDIETVVGKEDETFSTVIPYSNAYEVCCEFTKKVGRRSSIRLDKEKDYEEGVSGVTIKSKPSLSVFVPMIEAIKKHGVGYHHYISAYNGGKFDHILLFQFLLESGHPVISEPNPTGSSHTYTFALPCTDSSRIDSRISELKPPRGKVSKKELDEHKKKHVALVEAKQKGVSYITVWDPVLYIRKSLDAAAKDFKIPVQKAKFNHTDVQKAYDEDRLEEWLAEHEREVVDYNKMDVEVLKQLTMKLFECLEEITGIGREEIVKVPTISGFAYKWWKQIMTELGTDSEYVCAESHLIDKIIRSAMIAGRVQGDLGYMQMLMVLVDVVSLYPFCMKTFKFPRGSERVITDKDDAEERLRVGQIGIYSCRYNQDTLRGKHVIIPSKTKQGTYDWKTPSDGVRYLPLPTIDCLSEHECEVGLEIPKDLTLVTKTEDLTGLDDDEFDKRWLEILKIDGSAKDVGGIVHYKELDYVYAVVWDNDTYEYHKELHYLLREYRDTSTGWERREVLNVRISELESILEENDVASPFQEYVSRLEALKNQQDEYIASGDPRGNPALREMIKMLLNALSGKVAQRNFTGRNKLLVGGQKVRDWFTDATETCLDANGCTVNKKGISTVDMSEVTQVRGETAVFVSWQESEEASYRPKTAKPSQLAVFIYAYARKYMYDNVFSKMHVYYTDTDSALVRVEDFDNHITHELKPIIVGEQYEKVVVRKKVFGDYEVETLGDGGLVCDAAIIVAPKTYMLLNKGNVVKYKCKGIRKTDEYVSEESGEKVKISDKPLDFYLMLDDARKKGGGVDIYTEVWGRSYGKNKMIGVRIHEQVKEIVP